MNFLVQNEPKYNLSPIYDIKEQAFFTEPEITGGISIMIDAAYTSLEVSLISSTLYCVSGFNPQKTWEKAHLVYPKAIQGLVKVTFDVHVQQGIGIDYAVDWKTFYDKSTGVICIGNSNIPHDAINVEFANNTIASIDNGHLVAVWFKPSFVK